jgi:hypothetical protein
MLRLPLFQPIKSLAKRCLSHIATRALSFSKRDHMKTIQVSGFATRAPPPRAQHRAIFSDGEIWRLSYRAAGAVLDVAGDHHSWSDSGKHPAIVNSLWDEPDKLGSDTGLHIHSEIKDVSMERPAELAERQAIGQRQSLHPALYRFPDGTPDDVRTAVYEMIQRMRGVRCREYEVFIEDGMIFQLEGFPEGRFYIRSTIVRGSRDAYLKVLAGAEARSEAAKESQTPIGPSSPDSSVSKKKKKDDGDDGCGYYYGHTTSDIIILSTSDKKTSDNKKEPDDDTHVGSGDNNQWLGETRSNDDSNTGSFFSSLFSSSDSSSSSSDGGFDGSDY